MASVKTILLFLGLLGGYALGVGVLASLREVPLWTFWSGVLGALAPWVLGTAIVLVASMMVPQRLQQAAGMSVLVPMLGTLAVAFLSPIASLLMRTSAGPEYRLKVFAIVASVPAAIVVAGLLVVFVNDSLKR